MVYISPRGMKLMRVIHIVAAQIWFGAVICIFGFALYCFNNTAVEQFLVLAPMIPELYKMVVLPAAIACILQGIIYGIFSPWGFVKFKWVLAKWILAILVVLCTGMGGIGQMFMIVDTVQKSNLQHITLYDGTVFFIFIGGQMLLLCIMTILSVLKPKNKK